MKRFALPLCIFLLLLCLNACSGDESDIQNAEPLYIFQDLAVKNSIERFFDKSADELTADDFYELSKLHSLSLTEHFTPITTLRDLPELFPELRHLKIGCSWREAAQLSEPDIMVLEEMDTLLAVEIFADGLPSLDFTGRLPYVSLRYTEEALLSGESNLAEASVLGRNFIESRMMGSIMEYVKVADGERVYELIVSNYEMTDDPYDWFFWWHEAKVFVSEKRNGEYHFLFYLEVTGRIGNVSGGLILTDVNFDGHKDILVSLGHFGNQALVRFACFLYVNGRYKQNDSFSEIANPSLDVQNKKVLSTWRNWAASHSWAMFSYENSVFTETHRLTWQPEERGEYIEGEHGLEIISRRFTIEHFIDGIGSENTITEIYLSSDYTDDEWTAMFFDENSLWGFYSDKWRTMYNQGTLMDWSIYGSGMDVQIMEIIG